MPGTRKGVGTRIRTCYSPWAAVTAWLVGVYLRESRRRNKDGTVVSYLQLAHNERHPPTCSPVAKMIHNFGRADKGRPPGAGPAGRLDLRFLEPGQAIAAAAACEVEVPGSRPMGGAWVLGQLWEQWRSAARSGRWRRAAGWTGRPPGG